MDGWTISIDATADAGVTDTEVDQLVELFRDNLGVAGRHDWTPVRLEVCTFAEDNADT